MLRWNDAKVTRCPHPHPPLRGPPSLAAMKNWKDPTTVAQDFSALINFIHILMGIVIWEFVATCHFELAVLFGRRPYRWTIWIYMCCRLTAVLCYLCVMIGLKDTPGATNCRAWYIAINTFGYTSQGLASLIIVVRIVAIWERRVSICGPAIALWLGSVAMNIHHIAKVRVTYKPVSGSCIPLDTDNSLVDAIGVLASDMGLLIIMLAGIMRHRPYGAMKLLGPQSMWGLLWNQSLMWLALALLCEIPNVVLLSLNLNDAINLLTPLTMVAVLSLGATRMYRGLSNYTSLAEANLTNTSIRTPIPAVRIRRTHTVHRDDGTVVADHDAEPGLPMGRIRVDFDGALDAGHDKGTQQSNEFPMTVLVIE
ncbi:hypothetical protein FA95DRAFT_336344 [Auriscalpium vulgare]|uniref:Uncharacterized protein n=1 Tax=Auriscalpium vulgare TaxID=40419 RepID=A0ACB8RJF9_9AGAM|nr:hypothetical protein FA95DRAFT_336344 [Auriscalpium vulgare]